MADVAKTKLLRALILSGVMASSSVLADETRFADGATGGIIAPLEEIDQSAKDDDRWLEDRLQIQDPLPSLDHLDMEDFRERALNDPRVRKLLNAEGGATDGEDGNVRYANARIFLFASFSMPAVSLRQMIGEAEEFGIPVVFRGFVENSVFRTREEILRVFGSEEAAKGFSIDPTLFARFNVEAVPIVVALGDDLAACDFPGCSDDLAPDHDRVTGNIPLKFALETIANGGGVAAAEARQVLGRRSNP